MYCLICAKQYLKHFINVNSLDPHNHPKEAYYYHSFTDKEQEWRRRMQM